MADAKRDANQVTASLGSFNGVPTPLKVDNVTGRLKATIIQTALDTPTTDITRAKRDDNQVTSDTGSFGGIIKPFLVRNSDGYLRGVIV